MNREITELEHNQVYKYSEIKEANGINRTVDKEKIILLENKSHIKNKTES